MIINQILSSTTGVTIISFYCHGFEDDTKGAETYTAAHLIWCVLSNLLHLMVYYTSN
jgi:hypothetical protein